MTQSESAQERLPPIQRAASVAQEMASEIRLHSSGGAKHTEYLLQLLAKLLQSPAETQTDALALAATANLLLPTALASVGDDERLAADCAVILLHRTIETLERLSGVRAEALTGRGPAVN
jgi:sugar (pentulose or hexulose) kinase